MLVHILAFSEEAGDKVLVFSHSIPTLDYVAHLMKKLYYFLRIHGDIDIEERQWITNEFNNNKSCRVCLISTTAGGVGLNLFGANRVVILDTNFNPMWEQQAVGRAYRIGQKKPVFVYRLAAAGTFEQIIQNQGIFKEHLAMRVVDKRNPTRRAVKDARDYLLPLQHVDQEDLEPLKSADPLVLDRVLETCPVWIRSITPTETYYVEDEIQLTSAEMKKAQEMQENEQRRRRAPKLSDRERLRAVQLATMKILAEKKNAPPRIPEPLECFSPLPEPADLEWKEKEDVKVTGNES